MRCAPAIAVALLSLVVAACRDPSPPAAPRPHDAGRPRRVFEPPAGEVRPAPPFAIRSDGVGPYLVDAELADVLDIVPRGPRIELLTIEGVAEYSLVRAEDEGLVIGSDRTTVAFVAAVVPELAKTSTGVGVGSTVRQLDAALGPPARGLVAGADPRMRVFSSLPGVVFVVERAKVVAVIVTRRAGEMRRPARALHRLDACTAGGALADATPEILAVARQGQRPGGGTVRLGCMSADAPEALVAAGDRIVVVVGSPGKLRRLATQPLPGLRFAVPVDVDGDGRDEIVAVSVRDRGGARVAQLLIARVEGSRLVVTQTHDVYQVSPRGAAWAGAHVDEVDLLLSVAVDDKRIEVGGLYLRRLRGRVREVAPLIPRLVPIRRPRLRPEVRRLKPAVPHDAASVDVLGRTPGGTDAGGGPRRGDAAPDVVPHP